MRAFSLFAAVCLTSSLALAACDDPTGFGSRPEIAQDTVLIGAPVAANADVPTALDITPLGFGGIGGGRFPERLSDAGLWDVAIRLRDGSLVLVPPKALGLASASLARAAVTEPIVDRTFTQVREAPPSARFVTDRAIPLRTGAVYIVRSRTTQNGCTYFAKVEPVEIDLAQARARLRVATSTVCGDERLTTES